MVVVAASFVGSPGPALADANEVSISPAAIEVAPGGSATVQLIADPPAETLAFWIIDVGFDPEVVSTSSLGCDALDPLANSTAIGFCIVDDQDGDDVMETVKVAGAIVFNDDGSGLSERTVLADITFEVVGDPGRCTDLSLRVQSNADSDGEETNPLLFDGRICVEQDAPSSGTAVPHTPDPRTSEPTPPDDGETTSPSPESDTPVRGDETPASGTVPGSPGASSPELPATGEGDEDGGGSGLIWVLIVILAGLIVVSGAAWAVVRRRGTGTGPEGGPSA